MKSEDRINVYKARKMAHEAGPEKLVTDDPAFDALLNDIEITAKSGSFSLVANNDEKWFTVRHIVELHKLGFKLDLVEDVRNREDFDIEIRWDDRDE